VLGQNALAKSAGVKLGSLVSKALRVEKVPTGNVRVMSRLDVLAQLGVPCCLTVVRRRPLKLLRSDGVFLD
jgi:hypothetical protein